METWKGDGPVEQSAVCQRSPELGPLAGSMRRPPAHIYSLSVALTPAALSATPPRRTAASLALSLVCVRLRGCGGTGTLCTVGTAEQLSRAVRQRDNTERPLLLPTRHFQLDAPPLRCVL